MSARVRGPMAAAMRSGSMLRVRASTSTNTGRAPTSTMTLVVATQLSGVVITSSPGPIAGEAQGGEQRRGAGVEHAHRPTVAGEAEPRLEGADFLSGRWSASPSAARRRWRWLPARQSGVRRKRP